MIQVGGIKDLIKILIRLKYFKINICSSSFTLFKNFAFFFSDFKLLRIFAFRFLQGISQLSNCKTAIYWSMYRYVSIRKGPGQ